MPINVNIALCNANISLKNSADKRIEDILKNASTINKSLERLRKIRGDSNNQIRPSVAVCPLQIVDPESQIIREINQIDKVLETKKPKISKKTAVQTPKVEQSQNKTETIYERAQGWQKSMYHYKFSKML
jgi:hypothetical protein